MDFLAGKRSSSLLTLKQKRTLTIREHDPPECKIHWQTWHSPKNWWCLRSHGENREERRVQWEKGIVTEHIFWKDRTKGNLRGLVPFLWGSGHPSIVSGRMKGRSSLENRWRICYTAGLPDGSAGEEAARNSGDSLDASLIPESGRSPAGENGNPVQYSGLGNPMDRGAWRATVPGVAKS